MLCCHQVCKKKKRGRITLSVIEKETENTGAELATDSSPVDSLATRFSIALSELAGATEGKLDDGIVRVGVGVTSKATDGSYEGNVVLGSDGTGFSAITSRLEGIDEGT